MAKADIYFTGFETGDASQATSLTGTASIVSSPVRTGGYALRVNPTAAFGGMLIRGVGATGKQASFGRTAETFYTFYFRVASYHSSAATIATVQSAGNAEVVRISMSSTGVITLVGTSTSSTVATLSLATWYRLDLRVTSNGTSGLAIDGGTEQTITANNITQDNIRLGADSVSYTLDTFYDDLVIGTTALDAGSGPRVWMAVPIGAGNYTSWTDGTGNTYAEVDEVPHDSATSYLQNTSGTNQSSTFDMQSAATVGIVGTIYAVLAQAQMAESSSTTTGGGVRIRSGSTDSDSTQVDIGNANYLAIQQLAVTDPADAAAWTTTKFDAIEVGPYKGSDSSSIRCTAVYLHVVEDDVAVGGGGTTRRYSLSLTGVG